VDHFARRRLVRAVSGASLDPVECRWLIGTGLDLLWEDPVEESILLAKRGEHVLSRDSVEMPDRLILQQPTHDQIEERLTILVDRYTASYVTRFAKARFRDGSPNITPKEDLRREVLVR